jgi:hypothetical protein
MLKESTLKAITNCAAIFKNFGKNKGETTKDLQGIKARQTKNGELAH